MKNLETLQLELFTNTRIAMNEIHDATMLLINATGNPKLLHIHRQIIKDDIEKLKKMKLELRNLSIMDTFYNKY